MVGIPSFYRLGFHMDGFIAGSAAFTWSKLGCILNGRGRYCDLYRSCRLWFKRRPFRQ